jgi:glycosyltransferase involved in cell wall biosynthesis
VKVIQIIDSLRVGGAQTLETVFAREMLRRGEQVKVISLNPPDTQSPIYQELQRLNVEVASIPLRSLADLWGTRRIEAEIRASGADIVHTQLNYANIHGSLAARWAGIPSVASLHNASVHLYAYKPYRTRLETRALSRYARRIIACGHTVARVQQPRFKNKTLDVIPNPVPDLPEVSKAQRESARREFLPDGRGLLLVSVGRLIPEKGYADLIEAFSLAFSKLPQPVRLLIVGKGPWKAELQALVDKHGLTDSILLIGERNDVPALLAASDMYISASHYEGQSLAVLEAMLSALPVIATDVGDNRQIIMAECGLVLPPQQPDQLAQSILRLARDPKERKYLGQNASRCVRKNFAPAIWVERLLALYAEVLHG